jgi:hypothetical protein
MERTRLNAVMHIHRHLGITSAKIAPTAMRLLPKPTTDHMQRMR